MTTHAYAVSGMTCGHCAAAVTSELKSLDGVTAVHVDLVAGGTSTVTVASQAPWTTSRFEPPSRRPANTNSSSDNPQHANATPQPAAA